MCGFCVRLADGDHLGNVLRCLGGHTFGGEEKCIEVFGRKTEEMRPPEGHRRIERIILKWIVNMVGRRGVD